MLDFSIEPGLKQSASLFSFGIFPHLGFHFAACCMFFQNVNEILASKLNCFVMSLANKGPARLSLLK